MRFTNILILSFGVIGVKSLQSPSCGSERNSIYHPESNVTCYNDEDLDDLPQFVDKFVSDNSIFFIETSCKGGLNVREACSVEAAAQVNPSRQVHVLFTGPVSVKCANIQPLASLTSYSNVYLNRIYPAIFSVGSGLEHLLTYELINREKYPVTYARDLLKIIVVYKYSGVYMDMDVLSTRPLDELPYRNSWVSVANHKEGLISAAIFSAYDDDVGRLFGERLVSMLRGEQTVNALRDAVEHICGMIPFEKTKEGMSFNCHGLVLYAKKFFAPLSCYRSKSYFESFLNISKLTNSYTQQLCSSLTFDQLIPVNSTYHQLMRRFCPRVYGYIASLGIKNNFLQERDSKPDDMDLNLSDFDENEIKVEKPRPKVKWYFGINGTKTKKLYKKSLQKNYKD